MSSVLRMFSVLQAQFKLTQLKVINLTLAMTDMSKFNDIFGINEQNESNLLV